MLFPELKELFKLRALVGSTELLRDSTSNRMHGNYASLFHGLGVEFETVRPYVIGDDVRYIDWRVTARIGKPQVKTFRAECDRNVLVVVDANAYMRFGTRVTFKSVQAAKTAALLAWKSLQQQDRVGGVVFGDVINSWQYFKPAKSDSSVLRMFKLLCSKEINNHQQMSVATVLMHIAKITVPQSLVFIISDFSNEDMLELEKRLLALRKKCTVVLLPISDPADSVLPPVGMLTFASGMHTATFNTNDQKALKKYHAMWQNYCAQLTRLSKKFKIPMLWIDTMTDPVKILFNISSAVQSWKT